MIKILFRKKFNEYNINKLLKKIIINNYIFVIFMEVEWKLFLCDNIKNIKKLMCLDLNWATN